MTQSETVEYIMPYHFDNDQRHRKRAYFYAHTQSIVKRAACTEVVRERKSPFDHSHIWKPRKERVESAAKDQIANDDNANDGKPPKPNRTNEFLELPRDFIIRQYSSSGNG
jgi:hypothetical protein